MSDYTIIAEDPGDIVVTFQSGSGSGTPHNIPLKSLSVQKTTDVTPEYGTGWHQKYALVQGKVDYKGDFEIGTWWVSEAENPEAWMDLVRKELTWSEIEGLGREFMITISDVGRQYERTQSTIGGGTGPTMVSGAAIVVFERCLLTQDSLNIGNVGSTATTKYSFTCMNRSPA